MRSSDQKQLFTSRLSKGIVLQHVEADVQLSTTQLTQVVPVMAVLVAAVRISVADELLDIAAAPHPLL